MHALGSLQSVMKAKYSSPIFFTSNSPAPVPTSSSRSSSVRLTMRAPQALHTDGADGGGWGRRGTSPAENRPPSTPGAHLAMRLLSVFLTLRTALMLALIR